jgi:hypothetical protein
LAASFISQLNQFCTRRLFRQRRAEPASSV